MDTAVAAPDHDPRPIRVLVLEEALRHAITWLEAEVGFPRPEPHPAMAMLADDLRGALERGRPVG